MNLSRRAEVAAKWSRTASSEGVSSRWTCSNNNASNLSSFTNDRMAVRVGSIFEKQRSAYLCRSNGEGVQLLENDQEVWEHMVQWSSAANAVRGWLTVGCCCHLYILCFYRTYLIFLYWLSRGPRPPRPPIWLRPWLRTVSKSASFGAYNENLNEDRPILSATKI